MKVNIAKIKKQNGLQEEIFVKVLPKELCITKQDALIKGDIALDFRIANVGDVIFVEGTVQAVFIRVCGRCTNEYELICTGDFKEKFYPRGTEGISEEEFTFDDDLIDITYIARESLLLAEPIQSVCKEDCLGLCLSCGVNKNEQSCSCEDLYVDPRLRALQQLLKK